MHRFMPIAFVIALTLLITGCSGGPDLSNARTLSADVYFDKVHGAWQATMVANYTGLDHEGIYLDEPSEATSIELVLLDEWPTDDDTTIEWVDLHILETHGLEPSYEQIRDEWVDHLNYDIWVSTRQARDLMDEGVVPPETGGADLNPDGVWSIDAQLQTELFGLIAPGLPEEASRRAIYFAKITNSGFAIDASAFYTDMYARAFFESDIPTLILAAQTRFPKDALINQIVNNVRDWHNQHPDDWRETRRLIRDAYDDDPEWWGARVNFASAIMALLYGEGDMLKTMTIGSLAGWDADNNVTTGAGLLGIISGYEGLPDEIRNASDRYYNEDVTGDLPQYQTVAEIAKRTQALAEAAIEAAGGQIEDGTYVIPISQIPLYQK
ncbi:MAG: ADP-ribosylglycohydrolase family protein [Chloroflexota bacterium]